MQHQFHSKTFVLLFSIVTLLNVNDLMAQDYLNEAKARINLDLGEIYEIDFLPGINGKDEGFASSFLSVEKNNYREMFLSSSDTSKENSLTKLDKLKVADGNLLQVRFNNKIAERNK